MINLSIIIPAHNSEETIIPLIYSIFKQNISISYEILVVLDNCTDNTLKRITSVINNNNLRIIINNIRKGAGATRHLGAMESKGEVLLFLDSDILLIKENLINDMYNEIITNDYNIALLGMFYDEPINKSIGANFLALKSYYYDTYSMLKKKKLERATVNNFGGGPSIIPRDKYFLSKGYDTGEYHYKGCGGEEFHAGINIAKVCPIYFCYKYNVPQHFRNVFSIFFLAIKRTFNYTMIMYMLKIEKAERKIHYVVPLSDKIKLAIVFLIILNIPLSALNLSSFKNSALLFLAYLITDVEFMELTIKKRGIIFYILGIAQDMILFVSKGIGVILALLNIVILNDYKKRF